MCKKLIYCIFAMCSLWNIGCTNGTPEGASENEVVMDTTITEVKDTIVNFDPETSEESIMVVSRYDTVIVERKQ
ncbi:MAG: hypothetical protein KA479_08150 [Saprospiraceae bacterium]|nr:hypothetical protein [Saprospiraceae bacterium]